MQEQSLWNPQTLRAASRVGGSGQAFIHPNPQASCWKPEKLGGHRKSVTKSPPTQAGLVPLLLHGHSALGGHVATCV